MREPRVLFCASEMAPFVKTGGLADVTGALPQALARNGVKIVCVIPHYGEAMQLSDSFRPLARPLVVPFGHTQITFKVLKSQFRGVPLYALSHKELFHRRGIYSENGRDYPDNGPRFARFCRACLQLVQRLRFQVQLYHLHDWQTALLAVYLAQHSQSNAKTVFTVHNLAYQGLCPHSLLRELDLAPWYFHWQRLEFYGRVNLLKGGLLYSDAVSTVSPRYALEVQQPDFGCGLDGVLRERSDRLVGILNGIDTREWDPRRDRYLPARYSAEDLRGKAVCRRALLKEARIPFSEKPLFGVVSRLVEQKGMSILIPALEKLLRDGFPVVLLGTGDPRTEEALRRLKQTYRRNFGLYIAFDNRLAHLIEAGSDMFLMPSRFEPCGLNQFYSMRYGTVPVVRETGGLADSVVSYSPEGTRAGRSTGFLFGPYSTDALLAAIAEAVKIFADKNQWVMLMRNGMRQDFSWDRSAQHYLALYRRLLSEEAK